MTGTTQALNALMANVAKQVRRIFECSKKVELSERGRKRVREVTRMLEKEAVDAANLQMSTGKNVLLKVGKILESLRNLEDTIHVAIDDAADAEWLGEWSVERSDSIESECGVSDDEALEQAQNSLYVN